ncbi:hypothetical protein THRCLA_01634, partial [Thraustotheca clavata]
IIKVKYHEKYGATIFANLDVSKANWTALHAADGNCTGPITEFAWHVHTKWTNKQQSAFLSGCSLAVAGNHYDPDLACGPNSEHISDTCKTIISQPDFKYNCTPQVYNGNPAVCEKGDLSGKVGKMIAKNGWIKSKWYDRHYPAFNEATAQWNFMLHAVCGPGAPPRFICAIADTANELPTTTIPSTYAPK